MIARRAWVGVACVLVAAACSRGNRRLEEWRVADEALSACVGNDAAGEPLSVALDRRFAAEPEAFPARTAAECVPAARAAATAARALGARADAGQYATQAAALAGALEEWAGAAPKRLAIAARQREVLAAGDAWSAYAEESDRVEAWRFDAFLRCTLLDLDHVESSQDLLGRLDRLCATAEFQARLAACTRTMDATPQIEPPRFREVFVRLGAGEDRIRQWGAWGGCFRKGNDASMADLRRRLDESAESLARSRAALAGS